VHAQLMLARAQGGSLEHTSSSPDLVPQRLHSHVPLKTHSNPELSQTWPLPGHSAVRPPLHTSKLKPVSGACCVHLSPSLFLSLSLLSLSLPLSLSPSLSLSLSLPLSLSLSLSLFPSLPLSLSPSLSLSLPLSLSLSLSSLSHSLSHSLSLSLPPSLSQRC
jgi:hypothetical protein